LILTCLTINTPGLQQTHNVTKQHKIHTAHLYTLKTDEKSKARYVCITSRLGLIN